MSIRGTRCIGKPAATRKACRSCSCTADRAGAACRTTAATSTRRSGASRSSTSAARDGRRPLAELADNTTHHLVADLEQLRRHLGIAQWLLFGGSWGSTLALAYAEAHPMRCLGLVLRGIFLARPAEIDWFMHGMRHTFPEAWRAFSEFLPARERDDLLGSYYRRLTHPDPAVHMPAAHAWDRYEGACSRLLPSADPLPKFDSDASALAIARIEAHYFVHDAFLGADELLANVGRIRHLPCTIVQGRYDVICPPVTADELARAWPEAEYIVVPDAGHSIREPGITRELVAAMVRMQARLRARDHRPGRGSALRRVRPPRSSRTRNAISSNSSATSSPISGYAKSMPNARREMRPVTSRGASLPPVVGTDCAFDASHVEPHRARHAAQRQLAFDADEPRTLVGERASIGNAAGEIAARRT